MNECGDVRVMQVVETRLLRRGKGIENDPIRIITQYWTMDGDLLLEIDPLEKAFSISESAGERRA